jgi:hypothetical protein
VSNKLNPFSFLNSINQTNKDIMVDAESEKAYVPFIINRSLSYFTDTVFFANEMNKYHKLPKRMQFDFLRFVIRKRKRFAKWHKVNKVEDIDFINRYYGYNTKKSLVALSILTNDDLKNIREAMKTGGTT